MAEVTYISYSARAKSTTADGIFAEAHQILDVSKNKNQQAINAEVTTELGKKVAKSDFDSFKTSNTSAIAAKADKSYVDTELGKKATKSEVSAVDAKFAGVFCNVDEVINNGGEVRVTIDTVDKKKVDIDLPVYHKSVVDTKLGAKANSADVYTKTQVYTKGETDTKLGAKANSADVYTKAQADSAITAKVNAAVASVYRVKGTKATIAEVTALTNVKCGDVWNVTAEFTLGGKKYPAGTNVVALADKSAADAANWDALGGTVDLAGHTAEMKSWANGQFAGKAFEAKVTTNTSNISSLTTRVTAAEGKFAGYYTKGETDTKLGTKANSADVYTKLQTDNAISAVSDNMDVLYVNLIVQSSVAVTIESSSSASSGGTITFGKYKTGMGSLVSEGYGFYRTIGGRHYRDMGTISQPEGYGKATTILDYKGNKYFSDGTNLYFWDGKGPLKKIVDLSTVKSDVAKKANSEDVYTKGTIDTKLAEKATTASVNSLTTRVTAVETKASTNASNITNLTSRVGAVESKFSGYVPTATYNALAARVAELEALLKLA
jgi:hypothetical protein